MRYGVKGGKRGVKGGKRRVGSIRGGKGRIRGVKGFRGVREGWGGMGRLGVIGKEGLVEDVGWIRRWGIMGERLGVVLGGRVCSRKGVMGTRGVWGEGVWKLKGLEN